MASINDLPLDVISIILDNIPSTIGILNFMRTCRTYYFMPQRFAPSNLFIKINFDESKLKSNIWKESLLYRHRSAIFNIKNINLLRHLNHVSGEIFIDSDRGNLPEPGEAIKQYKRYRSNKGKRKNRTLRNNMQMMKQSFTSLQNLSKLVMNNVDLQFSHIQFPKSIEHLNIHNCVLSLGDFGNFSHMINLKTLIIRYKRAYFTGENVVFRDFPPSLKQLSVCMEYYHAGKIITYVDNLPEGLEFGAFYSVKFRFRQFPNSLKTLIVHGCEADSRRTDLCGYVTVALPAGLVNFIFTVYMFRGYFDTPFDFTILPSGLKTFTLIDHEINKRYSVILPDSVELALLSCELDQVRIPKSIEVIFCHPNHTSTIRESGVSGEKIYNYNTGAEKYDELRGKDERYDCAKLWLGLEGSRHDHVGYRHCAILIMDKIGINNIYSIAPPPL